MKVVLALLFALALSACASPRYVAVPAAGYVQQPYQAAQTPSQPTVACNAPSQPAFVSGVWMCIIPQPIQYVAPTVGIYLGGPLFWSNPYPYGQTFNFTYIRRR